MDIAKLGFQVDSRPVDKANKRLDDFARTGRKASRSTDQMSASSRRLDRAMSTAARGGIRNASYQIADVAVQMSMGTSAMRAMAIQLPQLLAGFGVLGAVLGAVAAIGGAIAPIFLDGSDATVALSDAVDDLTGALATYRRSAEMAVGSTARLQDRFGQFAGSARRDLLILERVDFVKAVGQMRVAIHSAQAEFDDLLDMYPLLVKAFEDANRDISALLPFQQEVIRNIEERLSLSFGAAVNLSVALERLGTTGEPEKLIEQTAIFRDALIASYGAVSDIPEPLMDVLRNLILVRVEAQQMLAAASASADEFGRAASAMSDAQFKMMGAYQQYAASRLAAPDEPPKPRRRRGGGKSAVEKLSDQYERLRGQIDPVWRATKRYEDAVATLDKALAAGLIGSQAEYNTLLELTKAKFGEVGDEIKGLQAIAKTMESSMTDAFMSMVDGTKTAKDAFADMARAIVKKLYEVLVVQQIVGSYDASTGTGSGIVGGILGGLFGGARADGGPVAAGRTYLVGERGPELFTPRTSGQIVPNGGSIVVNQYFSLSANGDESVKKIIAAEAPNIVNATKRAIIEARAAGGQMRTVFS